jgi:hypothetical protein
VLVAFLLLLLTPSPFFDTIGNRSVMSKSNEERVAMSIAESLDRVSLDLDEVGRNIARMDNLPFNRLIIVIEAAEEEKDKRNARESNTLY